MEFKIAEIVRVHEEGQPEKILVAFHFGTEFKRIIIDPSLYGQGESAIGFLRAFLLELEKSINEVSQ